MTVFSLSHRSFMTKARAARPGFCHDECGYFNLPLTHHALLGTPTQGFGIVAKVVGRGTSVTTSDFG
jgi:hypothetical protein